MVYVVYLYVFYYLLGSSYPCLFLKIRWIAVIHLRLNTAVPPLSAALVGATPCKEDPIRPPPWRTYCTKPLLFFVHVFPGARAQVCYLCVRVGAWWDVLRVVLAAWMSFGFCPRPVRVATVFDTSTEPWVSHPPRGADATCFARCVVCYVCISSGWLLLSFWG